MRRKKLSIVANVGPMYAPLTKAAYDRREDGVPPQLFSHNDQQSVWQSYGAEGTTVGWGGRFSELLNSLYGSTAAGSALANIVRSSPKLAGGCIASREQLQR